MQRLLSLLFLLNIFNFINAQHHIIVSDIHEAYDYYQSSHEGANTALHFISECFDCHTIECIKENVNIAQQEAEEAMKNAHFAKGESHSAQAQAEEICIHAKDKAGDAHGSFHDAKVVFDIASTTLTNVHYAEDMNEMHSHLTTAVDHIHDAIAHLNNGVDGLNNALGHIEYCKNR
ncbi:hypothetical protein [Flammeovirga sp. SJP92]|uniref:hypothetical protein n=1 Tax=Flammeovirga sp. SJP92 TaxID=1775430 RepID=UPI0007899EAA|nr:hypothetical protein [Flammeovirga sp. SJP92]KXX71751.1 hypothetical protein AVL50_02910 [Flammeovirga sp. SJP92]